MTLNTHGLANIEVLIEAAVESGSHPTAVVAVADRTETLWTHVVAGQDDVKLDSIFLLASITKPVIATAIMRLVEEGRLLLDLPVGAYIPEFATFGKEHVTTRHLLTHTSGLEGLRWEKELGAQGAPACAYLEAACSSYLHFAPGTRCEYSSISFWVLAELIDRLGDQPYGAYLDEHIFKPLGMQGIGFRPPDRTRAVPVHNFGGPEIVERFITLAAPGGGLWGTAGDLVTFGQAFLNGGQHQGYHLLGRPALEVMTRNHTPGLIEMVDGQPQVAGYGLGWGKPVATRGLLASEQSYGHGGASGTYFWVDPVWDLVFVFLTNRWGVARDVPRRALNAVYGALDAEPRVS